MHPAHCFATAERRQADASGVRRFFLHFLKGDSVKQLNVFPLISPPPQDAGTRNLSPRY